MSLTRFTWERELIANGPENPTTRHVLLTIGLYVRRKGSLECWPSIRKLELDTRLSQRCIIDHIEAAVSMGWLSKRQGQMQGMMRRGSIYTLRLPDLVPTAERRSVEEPEQPLNAPAPTAEPDSVQPLNLATPLHTSRSSNEIEKLLKYQPERLFSSFREKSKGRPLEAKSEGKAALQDGTILEARASSSLDSWAQANGLYRGTGESERDWRIRAGNAYALAADRVRAERKVAA